MDVCGNARPRRRSEAGAVTAEAAVLLPVLVVLMVAGLWAVGVVVANVRCIDAARDTARAVARGEPADVAVGIGARAAPPGAEIRIARDGPEVEVVVSAVMELDWLLVGGLPGVRVQGRSVVQVELAAQVGAGSIPARIGSGVREGPS